MADELKGTDGESFKFSAPSGEELPAKGYDPGQDTYQSPPIDRSKVQIKVDPKSDRLQLMKPFPKWNKRDVEDAPILIKVAGKCTTDHIRYS